MKTETKFEIDLEEELSTKELRNFKAEADKNARTLKEHFLAVNIEVPTSPAPTPKGEEVAA
jgi:hypothetical protein